jgi:hypothetical protein
VNIVDVGGGSSLPLIHRTARKNANIAISTRKGVCII